MTLVGVDPRCDQKRSQCINRYTSRDSTDLVELRVPLEGLELPVTREQCDTLKRSSPDFMGFKLSSRRYLEYPHMRRCIGGLHQTLHRARRFRCFPTSLPRAPALEQAHNLDCMHT